MLVFQRVRRKYHWMIFGTPFLSKKSDTSSYSDEIFLELHPSRFPRVFNDAVSHSNFRAEKSLQKIESFEMVPKKWLIKRMASHLKWTPPVKMQGNSLTTFDPFFWSQFLKPQKHEPKNLPMIQCYAAVESLEHVFFKQKQSILKSDTVLG